MAALARVPVLLVMGSFGVAGAFYGSYDVTRKVCKLVVPVHDGNSRSDVDDRAQLFGTAAGGGGVAIAREIHLRLSRKPVPQPPSTVGKGALPVGLRLQLAVARLRAFPWRHRAITLMLSGVVAGITSIACEHWVYRYPTPHAREAAAKERIRRMAEAPRKLANRVQQLTTANEGPPSSEEVSAHEGGSIDANDSASNGLGQKALSETWQEAVFEPAEHVSSDSEHSSDDEEAA